MFGFLDAFFEEHDFRDFLEVEFVFNGEPFDSNFIGIEKFIFVLDFDVFENIGIGDGEVVKVEGEMFVFHVLREIRS